MFEKFIEYVSMKIIYGLWGNYVKKKRERDAELVAITDIFGSVEPLLKYYVEPKCQNINPANYNEEEPDAVVRTLVFEYINNNLNRDYVVQGDGRNQLFVLSDAGLGKTSLLVMIKLCNLLPKLDFGLDINKRRRVELIKLDSDAFINIREIANKAETILLLDALDEDPLAWHKPEKRLLKVLQASSSFRKVIISCRTQFFPEKGVSTYGTQEKISIGGYVCPVVFLSWFDASQVFEYLEKRFPVSAEASNSIKQDRSLEILKKAKSLSFRPFLLSHIEDLLDSEDRNWTELSIYDELVAVWLRREVRKKSAIRMSEKHLKFVCIAIAAKMQESGKRSLTKNELSKIIKSIPAVSHINDIEYGSKSLLNRNSNGDYRFSHFSVQEYFLSKYVIALSDKQTEDNSIKRIPINKKRIRLTRKSLEFTSFHINSDWVYSDGFLLEGLVLDGFDLSEGNWSDCSFKDSSMRDTSFRGTNLTGANFSNAVLYGAILDQSICFEVNFNEANLTDASLENVRSDKANFNGAIFYNTNLRGLTDLGKLPKGTEFIYTIMPNGKRHN